MRIPAGIEVGAATGTGRVRSTNEDDFLVLVPNGAADGGRRGCLLVVADGMGGVTGGAEASRAAVRSVGRVFLGGDGTDTESRMREGFAAACRVVHDLSQESPRLSEMGTTMTALHLVDGRAVVGHVGDSRCLLWRGGELRQLTEDHAMTEPRNLLTRCIGAGQLDEEVDVVALDLRVGDTFVLLTDGVWGTVDDAELAEVLQGSAPQRVAERLVELADERGGPDNGTVLVVRIVRAAPEWGPSREVALPREEAPSRPVFAVSGRSLVPPRWPWLLLALSLVVGAVAAARLVYGVDLIGRVLALMR
jgi:protein phosphatase